MTQYQSLYFHQDDCCLLWSNKVRVKQKTCKSVGVTFDCMSFIHTGPLVIGTTPILSPVCTLPFPYATLAHTHTSIVCHSELKTLKTPWTDDNFTAKVIFFGKLRNSEICGEGRKKRGYRRRLKDEYRLDRHWGFWCGKTTGGRVYMWNVCALLHCQGPDRMRQTKKIWLCAQSPCLMDSCVPVWWLA